ncbi:Dopamine D2-like receptor [Halotydeus destructor]|nr:Dopamine D2-like receptor [Halotydeus destructor]
MFSIIVWTLDIIVVILTALANLLVIIFALKSKQSTSTLYIVSLAVADIGMAIFVMPFDAILTVNDHIWHIEPWTCMFYKTGDIFFWTTSVLHFMVIAIDRYQAVHMPLNYATKPRMGKVCLNLLFIWSTGFVTTFLLYADVDWLEQNGDLCLLNTKYLGIWSLFCFYIPLIVSSILYICVYRKLRSISGATLVSESRLRENRVTRVVLIAILCFVICVMPICVLNLLHTLGVTLSDHESAIFGFPPLVLSVMLIATHFNSTCNGILWLALNRDYRTKLFKLMRLRKLQPTRDPGSVLNKSSDESSL